MTAKKQPTSKVPAQVHNYLSENGKKGGEATKELVEAGKAAMRIKESGKKKQR